MTQAEKDRQFLIEYLAKDLIEMLVKDKGLSVRDAFDVLYQSETFKKVENQDTGLYYQSPVYVMDMLEEELSLRDSHNNNKDIMHNKEAR